MRIIESQSDVGPSAIERVALEGMLRHQAAPARTKDFALDDLQVTERRMTGVGAFSEFVCKDLVRAFSREYRGPWRQLWLRVNGSIVVGCLFYFADGCLASIEFHTYGEPWPVDVLTAEALVTPPD